MVDVVVFLSIFLVMTNLSMPVGAFGRFDFSEDYRETAYDDALPTTEYDSTYPTEEIRQFLSENKELRDYFLVVPELINRVNGGELGTDAESMCRAQIQYIRPKTLRNVNNVWRTIINLEGEYEQYVKEVICSSNGTCNEIASFPDGYTTACHQEYITVKLMVYNPSDTTQSFDTFPIPSCCLCKFKKKKI